MNQYLKAFVTALSDHFRNTVPKSSLVQTHTEGGCETCGYGGNEVVDDVDLNGILYEIDEFAKTFSDRYCELRSAVMQVNEAQEDDDGAP